MITDAMIVWMRDFDWTVKQRKKKGKKGYHRTAGKRLRETPEIEKSESEMKP